jgi:hypothetical protein
MGIKSVKEAQGLVEIGLEEMCTMGIGGSGLDQDDIIMFQDKDGRAMHIVSTASGYRKMVI